MTTIVDLPEEIYILIAKHLTIRSLHSCIRTCHSFYSSFIPHLWSHVHLSTLKLESAIPPTHVRMNAHHIESIFLHPALTEVYYNIVFPRLQKLQMGTSYDNRGVDSLVVKPPHKVLFVRQHPFVRKLVYYHKDLLPKEFWEAVGATWTGLETLEFGGTVDEGVEDAFLGVCDRVQDLSLTSVDFSGYNNALAILSMRSFRRLYRLKVDHLSLWTKKPYQEWPLRLLESVKRSEKLKRLGWNVNTTSFSFQMILDALTEACWPELCELHIGKFICSEEEDLTRILTRLPSRKLTSLAHSNTRLSSLAFNCLRDRYFGHLRELDLGGCSSVTSAMVQEVMIECVHLVVLDAFHVFVRDVATSQKPWICLGLEKLTLYFAKQRGDAAEWEGLVFQQISKLCQLLELNLKHDPHLIRFNNEPRSNVIMDLETLDLRLPSNSNSSSYSDRNGSAGFCKDGGSSSGGDDIRCWSSLVQLREFSFDVDLHTLGMDELVWMIENWRDLQHVNGEFKAIKREDECARRDRILREAELEVDAWDI